MFGFIVTLLESLLFTCAAVAEVAPLYPVSNFPTQKPLLLNDVNAGWVNHSPLLLPVLGVVSFVSNSISI